jgi:hypothetical protein
VERVGRSCLREGISSRLPKPSLDEEAEDGLLNGWQIEIEGAKPSLDRPAKPVTLLA